MLGSKNVDVDRIGERLADHSLVVRNMAKSWDAYGMSIPYIGSDGSPLGKILPGRGIYLDCDLKGIGIRRHVPFVFQRSPISRLLDRLQDERGAVSYQDVLDARDHKQEILHQYGGYGSAGSGFSAHSWQMSISSINSYASPFSGATPPVDYALTRSSGTTPQVIVSELQGTSGSYKKFLLQLGVQQTTSSGAVQTFAMELAILIDNHLFAANFRTNVTTAETIASPQAVSRQYGPSGNLGAGAQLSCTNGNPGRGSANAGNMTIRYKNERNVSSSTVAPWTNVTGSTNGPVPFDGVLANNGPFYPLGSGDFGVRSLIETQRATGDGSAGAVYLHVVQPLAVIPAVGDAPVELDPFMGAEGLIPIVDGAALGLMGRSNIGLTLGPPTTMFLSLVDLIP